MKVTVTVSGGGSALSDRLWSAVISKLPKGTASRAGDATTARFGDPAETASTSGPDGAVASESIGIVETE